MTLNVSVIRWMMKASGHTFYAGLAASLCLLPMTNAQSPPNEQIIFKRGSTIMTMNTDGSNQYAVAESVNGGWLACSPNGTQIAFVFIEDRNAVPQNLEIYVMNSDGTERKNLTNHPAKDSQPSWSPDSRQIAFASNRVREPEPNDIFIMNTDGSNVRPLVYGTNPSWSPDGQWIVFSSNRNSPEGWHDIYMIRTDGTNLRQINSDTAFDTSPVWSPDGSQIAFVSERQWEGPEFVLSWDIYLMNADGTNVHRLTDHRYIDWNPTWSPDGQQIAFERQLITDKGDNFEVFVMNADGTNVRNLTNDPASDVFPNWCPTPLATSVHPQGKRPFTWGWLKEFGARLWTR